MTEINALPKELVLMVLQYLPGATLKTAVQVSKLWKSLGEHPKLWTWCVVSIRFKKDIDKFSVGRLGRLQQISFSPESSWNSGEWEALFRPVIQLSSLKRIDGLQFKNFSSVEPCRFSLLSGECRHEDEDDKLEPDLFAKALTKLEEVDISGSILTHNQAVAFFTKISQGCALKKLDMGRDKMSWISGIDPQVLASGVNNLEEVTLSCNKDQLEAMFENKTQLKKLELCDTDLSLVNPQLFARALVKLEEVNLEWKVDVTYEQLLALFSEMMIKTELKKINLSEKDLSLVEPGLFASALVELECVDLNWSDLTIEQIQAFFTEMTRSSKLKKLVLSQDLSRLEPGLFARSLGRLEDVTLGYSTRTTNEQLLAFFLEMVQSSRMKKLQLVRTNLSGIDPEVLGLAVTGLEEVRLCSTKLSKDQITNILNQVLQDKSKMRKLDLRGNTAAVEVKPNIVCGEGHVGCMEVNIVRSVKMKLGDGFLFC